MFLLNLGGTSSPLKVFLGHRKRPKARARNHFGHHTGPTCSASPSPGFVVAPAATAVTEVAAITKELAAETKPEKTGKTIDVMLIMRLFVRHYKQEGEEPKQEGDEPVDFHNPSETGKFLREINRKIKMRRGQNEEVRPSLLNQRRKGGEGGEECPPNGQNQRKFATYNREMNPLSKQECEVGKAEATKKIEEKLASAEPSSEPVPGSMPSVDSVMQEDKGHRPPPGVDEVTYTMLREVMGNEQIANYITKAINRVLNGEEDIPYD